MHVPKYQIAFVSLLKCSQFCDVVTITVSLRHSSFHCSNFVVAICMQMLITGMLYDCIPVAPVSDLTSVLLLLNCAVAEYVFVD